MSNFYERKPLLTSDKKKVALLESIKIDETLPKFKRMEALKEQKEKSSEDGELMTNPRFSKASINDVSKYVKSYEELKKYFIENGDKEGVTDFNLTISENMRKILDRIEWDGDARSIFSEEDYTVGGDGFLYRSDQIVPKNASLWWKIKAHFKNKRKLNKKKKEEKRLVEKFDVVSFFSNVKLSMEEEVNKYKNRISEFITCIGYTEESGQTALKEHLFEQMVINKYESILYAKGFNKALTEENLVKFAMNSPKALSLDYVCNYIRNIPLNVLKEKRKVDQLEVFDNYVILHYDPENISYKQTPKEREREIEKAKDPILFGVIKGSKKLYYICDWIDEYCDITLDNIIDTLGKDVVEKGYIKEAID